MTGHSWNRKPAATRDISSPPDGHRNPAHRPDDVDNGPIPAGHNTPTGAHMDNTPIVREV